MSTQYFKHSNDILPAYGSVLYYAYRKIEQVKIKKLYALDQIKSQILSCTELFTNQEVAVEKLNWWIKQINNLKDSSRSNIRQLNTILDSDISVDKIYNMIMNDITYSMEMLQQDEKDLDEYFTNNFLGIEKLKYMILTDKQELDIDDNEIVQRLNKNNEIVRNILCISHHHRNQIIIDINCEYANKETVLKSIRDWSNKYLRVNNKNKKISALIKCNKIYYKMMRKYLGKINNPLEEVIIFSPLSLLLYSL